MRKLLRAMLDEYKARAPYIAYLVRCRQGLLSTLAHIERLHNRVKRSAFCFGQITVVLVACFSTTVPISQPIICPPLRQDPYLRYIKMGKKCDLYTLFHPVLKLDLIIMKVCA